MQYTSHYCSPIGDILLAADDIGLTGLWFEGQKYFALYLDKEHEEKEVPLFEKVKQWLDIYFSGKEPDFTVPLHFTGTDFQNEVWEILYTIPYGQTMTDPFPILHIHTTDFRFFSVQKPFLFHPFFVSFTKSFEPFIFYSFYSRHSQSKNCTKNV